MPGPRSFQLVSNSEPTSGDFHRKAWLTFGKLFKKWRFLPSTYFEYEVFRNYKVDVVNKMIKEADFKKNEQVAYDKLLVRISVLKRRSN